MNTKIRTMIIGLIAASSFATATVAPAVSQADTKSPTGPAASCTYKGASTSDGGVVLQDDGIYYKCVNGSWVYDHKAATLVLPPPPKSPVIITKAAANLITSLG